MSTVGCNPVVYAYRERERGPLPCLANVFVVFWIGGGKEVVAELVTYEDAGHS